ncbi:MAG: hypothetical protein Q4A83_08805, partial [Bacillota bacterium]|nr:hypothetical protein [Bacillota bacterium]
MKSKQKITRKSLALLLVIAMCISLMPTFAFAAADDVTYTRASSIEVGKEYLFVGKSGSGSSGYALANNNNYSEKSSDGVSGQKCTLNSIGDTITVSSSVAQYVTWEAVESGSGIAFKCGDKYLSAASNTSVAMSGTPVALTVSGLKVTDGSSTLCYGSNAVTSSYIFNFNTSSSSAVDVYVKDSGEVDPPAEEGIVVELTPSTDNPSEDVTIEVGESFTVKLTNGGSSEYTFTATSSKPGIASLSESSVKLAKGATGEIEIEGLADGTVTITFSNNGQYGVRKATINLTVGDGGSTEPEVKADVEFTPTTSNPSESKTIAVNESIRVRLTNGGSSEYTFKATPDKDGVAKAEPASVTIAQGGTGDIVITGLKDGKVTVTFANGDNSYSRKATLELTVGNGGDEPAEDAIPVEATKGEGTTTNVSLKFGEEITLALAHASSASKDFTIEVNNPSVVQITPESAITVANGATGYITLKALAAGTATITFKGVNSASVGQGGSTYIATIKLTVTPESGEHVHSFGNVSYVWSDDFSTCTASRQCVSCDAEEIETVSAVKAHKDASCSEEGSDTYTATFENEAFKTQTEVKKIPKIYHTSGDAVRENEVAATCQKAGSYDEVIYCTVCNHEISKTTKAIAKLDHTVVTDAAVAATCTEAGLTEGSHCSVCNEVIVAQNVVAALGHNYKDGKCTRCGADDPSVDGTVYTLANSFEMGKTYLIVTVKDGSGVALANNNSNTSGSGFTTIPVTVADGKIIATGLEKAEWEAKAASSASLIGLYNGSNVLKVNGGNSPYIKTGDNSYSAGGFGYTSNNHVSYPYSSTNYFIGSTSTSFTASASESGLGEVYIFVKGEGGDTPVDPPVSGTTIEITPTTGNPKDDISINVGESFILKLINGSSRENYTFTLSFDKDGVASASSKSIDIAMGETGEIVITGANDGTVTISITNDNGDYARTAEVKVTVGNGSDEPAEDTIPVEATTGDGTTTDVSLKVGETITLALTHASRASKDFTIEVNNLSVVQITPEAAITVDTGATGYITLKALAAGTATITLAGVNSASVGQSGSTYIATIKLTVAPESGEHVHSFGTVSYVWSDDFSTCTASRQCVSCDAEEIETVIAVKAHKDASCSEEGSDTYTATFENKSFEEQAKVDAIEKLEHTPVTDAAVEATCTETGLTEGSHCSVCGEIIVAQQEVAMKAHTPGEAVRENEVAATCKAAGSYDEVVYCTVCNHEISRTTKTIEKLEHTPVTDAAVEATCTETGLTEGSHCSVCGEIIVAQRVVAMKAHTPGEAVRENVKDATCREAGSYDEVVYCTVCNHEISRTIKTIAKLNHKPGEVIEIDIIPATCQKEGSYTEITFCADCETLISREVKAIEKTDHTVVVDAAVAATCTHTGLTEGSHCSVCGETIVAQQIVPKKAHTPAAAVQENIVDATCTRAGSYDEVIYCADCGAQLSSTHVNGETLPHTPGEAV